MRIKYRKVIFVLIVVLLCCSFNKQSDICEMESSSMQTSLSTAAETNYNDSNEESVKKVLTNLCKTDVLFWSYGDYDGDGKKEAFAVTGENDNSFKTLWYVSAYTALKLDEKVSYDTIFVFDIKTDKKYICLSSEMYQNYSLIWGVNDGTAYETPISNVGQRFAFNGINEYTIIQSEFDGTSVGGRHTYKPYYFYYDYNNGDFCEYGGTEITIKELCKYENAKIFLDNIKKEKGTVTSILKRGNGIININYSVPYLEASQDIKIYYNITLKINNTNIYYIDKNNGIYLPALVPEIAQYPK